MRKNLLLLAVTLIWTGLAFAGGGPDTYGYTWLDSNDPGGPAYSWVDITTTGTQVSGLADDNVVGPFGVGFDFQFYWIKRDAVYIGSNGYVAFQNINIASSGTQAFPATPTPGDGTDEFVAPFLADLSFAGAGNAGKVFMESRPADQLFIVSFIDVPFWTNNAAGFAGANSFQVILNGTDSTITYNYQQQMGVWNSGYDGSTNPLVVGMENVSGTIGLMVSNNTYPPINYSVKFKAPSVALIDVPDVEPSVVQNDANGGFYVIKGASNSLNTTIGNVGNVDITSAITVNATVRDTNNNLLYTDNQMITPPFAQGATNPITFAIPFAPPLSGPYSLTVTTTNADDINNLNNSRTVEAVALDTVGGEAVFQFGSSNPVNLATANGGGIINWTGGSGNSGAGVYMEPYGYPILINAVELSLANFIGHTPAPTEVVCKVALYDDDPGGAVPGALLWTHDVLGSEAVLSNGILGVWTRIDLPAPVVIPEGGFYMGYVQVSDSIFLVTEQAQPISKRTYEILDNTWAVYRSNNTDDLWVRVIADVSNAVVPTGINDELSAINDFNVYPNPNSGIFSMDLSLDQITDVTIKVFDMQGRKVYIEMAGYGSEFNKELDLSRVSPGMYIVRVETPIGHTTKRVVIE